MDKSAKSWIDDKGGMNNSNFSKLGGHKRANTCLHTPNNRNK